MRLICPNCGAQYEVPDDVIPENGRDVQCSNCGHTWFEMRATADEPQSEIDIALPNLARDAAEAAQDAAYRSPPTPPEPPQQPIADPVPDDSDSIPGLAGLMAEEANPDPQDAENEDWDDEEDTDDRSDDDARPTPPEPRGLSPEIAEILRQEAELETARRRDPNSLESQPDLGLTAAAPSSDTERQRAEEARRRLALLKGEPTIHPDAARRERLPDIEEINSTLRATSERSDRASTTDDAEPKSRGGFRLGFWGVVLIAGLGLGVYAYAPLIAAKVPQTEPMLKTYVEKVDDVRLWLDLNMQVLLEKINGSDAATN